MMSRKNTLPSLSSSRQMMMAWKVSGLSHRPAIMASRPASMRFAIAISPSRDNSSTEPISADTCARDHRSARRARISWSPPGGTVARIDEFAVGVVLLGLLLGLLGASSASASSFSMTLMPISLSMAKTSRSGPR